MVKKSYHSDKKEQRITQFIKTKRGKTDTLSGMKRGRTGGMLTLLGFTVVGYYGISQRLKRV
jgi:hypothetical protein